jgi:hypothetical protein
MEHERRKTIRINKSLVARYSLDGMIWDMSHVRDFSEGGLQITTNKRFAAGEILRLRTKIPLEPFVWQELCGRVIDSAALLTRFNNPMYDTCITRIELFTDDAQKTLLRNYVAWFLSACRNRGTPGPGLPG